MLVTNILESGTTDSVQSSTVNVKSQPVGIHIFGTLGSDTADLQVQASDDTWSDVYDADGQVVLSSTRPQVLIEMPGKYRLNVGTRTGAWGADASPYDTLA